MGIILARHPAICKASSGARAEGVGGEVVGTLCLHPLPYLVMCGGLLTLKGVLGKEISLSLLPLGILPRSSSW